MKNSKLNFVLLKLYSFSTEQKLSDGLKLSLGEKILQRQQKRNGKIFFWSVDIRISCDKIFE